MFSPKRNAKRTAGGADDEAVAADTAAQSLANLGGDDAASSTPKKKAKTTTTTTIKAAAAAVAAETTTTTRRSTRGAPPPAATAAPTIEATATTPSRVAGASVLASMGGTGAASAAPPALPAIDTIEEEAGIAVVASEGGAVVGGAAADYLLQGLVHATQVTSPLPVPSVKNRKEKSLGVLCRAFLELYKDLPPNRDNNGTVIEICQVAEHLGVKRRRIYDVINILESLDIVCRVKKNTYRWHGKDQLPKYFAKLQYEGKEELTTPTPKKSPEGEEEDEDVTPEEKEKIKGMASTCRKLIQSFLVSERTEIGLTEAAEEVLGPLSPDEEANAVKAMKTKVLRMYDIANVLASIDILQKENVGSTSLTNKPSFRWVYPILPSDMKDHLDMTMVLADREARKEKAASAKAAKAKAASAKSSPAAVAAAVAVVATKTEEEEEPTVEV